VKHNLHLIISAVSPL